MRAALPGQPVGRGRGGAAGVAARPAAGGRRRARLGRRRPGPGRRPARARVDRDGRGRARRGGAVSGGGGGAARPRLRGHRLVSAPGARPVVLYLVTRFPAVTETFVVNEWLALSERLEMRLVALRRSGEAPVHPETARVLPEVRFPRAAQP